MKLEIVSMRLFIFLMFCGAMTPSLAHAQDISNFFGPMLGIPLLSLTTTPATASVVMTSAASPSSSGRLRAYIEEHPSEIAELLCYGAGSALPDLVEILGMENPALFRRKLRSARSKLSQLLEREAYTALSTHIMILAGETQ